MYKFVLLSSLDKQCYIDFKVKFFLDKIKEIYHVEFNTDEIKRIKDIDVKSYKNLRKLNRQIENNIVRELRISVHL